MQRSGKTYTTADIAKMGLLFALAIVFSFIEGLLPVMPNGIKLGLSNIITMYCLFFLGRGRAFTLAMLKSLFVALTRGAVAGMMSAFGGICSVLIMAMLLALGKDKVSYLTTSVMGGVFHNIGQLIAAYVVLKLSAVFYYLPIMVISGVVMGSITGISLRLVLPYMDRISK